MLAPSHSFYPSDVDDATWNLTAPILARTTKRGRPRQHTDRLIYNAILSVVRGGIPWQMLPDLFPPWRTVNNRFRRWADTGIWEKLTDTLRVELRIEMGREPTPSAGIVDSQSVATEPRGGPIGFEAGKKVKGRKRHLVVDTQGNVMAALVTPANVPDPVAAPDVLARTKAKSARLKLVWADGRYQGPIAQQAARRMDLPVEVVSPLA